MFIRTKPASASVSVEACVPSKDRPNPKNETVSFQLLPADEDGHLDLDTGEVFQAAPRKNDQKLISASITVHEVPDDSYYQYNLMHYVGGIDDAAYYHPPSICFDAFIEPTALRELVENIRNGILPENITIKLSDQRQFFTVPGAKKAALEFGWEPDGSGKIWHNKEEENQTVPIESVRFDYAVVQPRHDEEDRLLPIQSDAPTDHLSEQVALMQTNLTEILKYLRWVTGIATVMLVIMIGISMR